MATKLGKGEFPVGAKAEDFQCFGPAATKDGEFDNVMLADMGCFNQEGVDSNKYYHACVCQHRQTGKWYTYFEWGRTGAKNPQFQFIECGSQAESQREFAKQCHEKNDRRGEWATVGGMRILRAKKDKDCYLVRPQARRSTGLPDARTIAQNEGAKPKPQATSTKKVVDEQTMLLMRDLNMGVVKYTRSSIESGALPTQTAIDEGRIILQEAKKRLVAVGHNIDDQVNDRDLKSLTAQLYGRIPKVKALHIAPEKWLLNESNIRLWEDDLDAFESALSATDSGDAKDYDPFTGLDVRMEYLPADSKVGAFIREATPRMTNGRNGFRPMKIFHVWKVEHPKAESKFAEAIGTVGKVPKVIKADLQPRRLDLPDDRYKLYEETNTALLVHGSRTVNISGILKSRLRLPQQLVGVTITGALLGGGLYFASDWQKSAGYTSLDQARWSGGGGSVAGRKAFIFLADVVLGSVYVAPKPEGFTSPPRGHHSVMGKANYTKGSWGALVNDEHVIYNVQQHQLRYLIEFVA